MIERLLHGLIRRETELPEPIPSDVAVLRSAWIPVLGGWLSGMGGPAAAVTIGRMIIVHPKAPLSRRLLRHELAHVRQWQRQPWTFSIRYALNHLRYGYEQNPFEVEARNAERIPPAATREDS